MTVFAKTVPMGTQCQLTNFIPIRYIATRMNLHSQQYSLTLFGLLLLCLGIGTCQTSTSVRVVFNGFGVPGQAANCWKFWLMVLAVINLHCVPYFKPNGSAKFYKLNSRHFCGYSPSHPSPLYGYRI